MKLTARQIPAFLENAPKEVRAVLLYGPNLGQVKERAQKIGRLVVEDLNDAFNVARLTGDAIKDEPARFFDETAAMSLMGGQRLVRIEDAGDTLALHLKEYLENPSPDCFVLVTAGELKPASPLRKLFEGHKQAAALACYLEEERNIAGRVREICQHAGYGIERDAVEMLAIALAGDSALMRGEVEKLLTYKGPVPDYEGPDGAPLRRRIGEITLEDVLACNPNMRSYSLDDMVNAASLGRTTAASDIMRRSLQEGTAPIAVMRTLQRHFRRLLITQQRIAAGTPPADAMKALQPPVFFKFENEFMAQLNRWPVARIEAALDAVAQAEIRTKSGGEDPAILCRHLVFGISRMAA